MTAPTHNGPGTSGSTGTMESQSNPQMLSSAGRRSRRLRCRTDAAGAITNGPSRRSSAFAVSGTGGNSKGHTTGTTTTTTTAGTGTGGSDRTPHQEDRIAVALARSSSAVTAPSPSSVASASAAAAAADSDAPTDPGTAPRSEGAKGGGEEEEGICGTPPDILDGSSAVTDEEDDDDDRASRDSDGETAGASCPDSASEAGRGGGAKNDSCESSASSSSVSTTSKDGTETGEDDHRDDGGNKTQRPRIRPGSVSVSGPGPGRKRLEMESDAEETSSPGNENTKAAGPGPMGRKRLEMELDAEETSSPGNGNTKAAERAAAASTAKEPVIVEGLLDSNAFAVSKVQCTDSPLMSNPLHNPALFRCHLRSLRLESKTLPLRPLLSRLMSHPAHNRRGIFNTPVDAVALGLHEYHNVIKCPMDLGTVKARLHANAYGSVEDAVADIRLVFWNARTYNPPGNIVHEGAERLWELFVEWFGTSYGVHLDPVLGDVDHDEGNNGVGGPHSNATVVSGRGKSLLAAIGGGVTGPSGRSTLGVIGSQTLHRCIVTAPTSTAPNHGSSPAAIVDLTRSHRMTTRRSSSFHIPDGNDDTTGSSVNGGCGGKNPLQQVPHLHENGASTAEAGDKAACAAEQPVGGIPTKSLVVTSTTGSESSKFLPFAGLPNTGAPNDSAIRPATIAPLESQPTGSAPVPAAVQTTLAIPPEQTSIESNPIGMTTAQNEQNLSLSTSHCTNATPYRPPPRSPVALAMAQPHYCASCKGRTCPLCERGCLSLEPTLLICNGANCRGAKIRRGAVFFVADDGTRQWCQRCYASLPAIIPDEQDASLGLPGKYKRDLLKRRNDEEVVERWISCTKCDKRMHEVCAMYDSSIAGSNYICPFCNLGEEEPVVCSAQEKHVITRGVSADDKDDDVLVSECDYTFVAGKEAPETIKSSIDANLQQRHDAKSLPTCAISSFIEKKVQERMLDVGCPKNAEKTLLVRVISDFEKEFEVPDVVQRHFRMETVVEHTAPSGMTGPAPNPGCEKHRSKKRQRTLLRSSSSLGLGKTPFVPPPASIKYYSKAIALFQKTDGLDVCVFCMYVQEYNGDDDVDADVEVVNQGKRVYIAYLDSVEHFRPRSCRTEVYHEILVAYLASARRRGYETAHIWACPPVRGNSFVFWNHPNSQKTPTKDRLTSWYHSSLSRAVECGVVTDVKSLYEHSFKKYNRSGSRVVIPGASVAAVPMLTMEEDDTIMICPPLLDGDMWIEEAVRLHSVSISRHLKNRTSFIRPENTSTETTKSIEGPVGSSFRSLSCCPAVQVADILHSSILAHPSSAPFRRPVNASALKLKDYYDIITEPMDLGTVHSRTLLGEYDNLRDLVADVELVFRNAMRYNPKGHFVHTMAFEMQNFFFSELRKLAGKWKNIGVECTHASSTTAAPFEERDIDWRNYQDMSMRLSTFLDFPESKFSQDRAAPTTDGDINKLTGILTVEPTQGRTFPITDEFSGPSRDSVDAQTVEKSQGGMIEIAPQVIPLDGMEKPRQETPLLSTEMIVSPARKTASCEVVSPSEIVSSIGKNNAVDILSTNEDKGGGEVERKEKSGAQYGDSYPAPTPPQKYEKDDGIIGGAEDTTGNDGGPSSKRAKTSNNQRRPKTNTPFPRLDLRTGGPEAIAQRMVGEDYWLFDKTSNQAASSKNKRRKKKRKRASAGKSKADNENETVSTKRRKESWLGDEVGTTMRKMRRDFFVCSLGPAKTSSTGKGTCISTKQFDAYASGFDTSYVHGCAVTRQGDVNPGVADARHAFIEFSQYRNLEFETLRKAKHSTAIILYYLHNVDAPGLVPVCSACKNDIRQLRWHRLKRPSAKRKRSMSGGFARSHDVAEQDLELCESCYTISKTKEAYIPIRISFERRAR